MMLNPSDLSFQTNLNEISAMSIMGWWKLDLSDFVPSHGLWFQHERDRVGRAFADWQPATNMEHAREVVKRTYKIGLRQSFDENLQEQCARDGVDAKVVEPWRLTLAAIEAALNANN